MFPYILGLPVGLKTLARSRFANAAFAAPTFFDCGDPSFVDFGDVSWFTVLWLGLCFMREAAFLCGGFGFGGPLPGGFGFGFDFGRAFPLPRLLKSLLLLGSDDLMDDLSERSSATDSVASEVRRLRFDWALPLFGFFVLIKSKAHFSNILI